MPPPVAVNAALVPLDSVMPPLKLIVAPVLPVSDMPVPGLSVIAPEKLSDEPESAVFMVTYPPIPDVLLIVPP